MCERTESSVEITTIIPVYNGERYLRECLDSAIAQRHVRQEILVVDDGSNDATGTILEEYESRFDADFFRVLRQANAGHIAARNRAARKARGAWLAFLDADDCWEPEKLLAQKHRIAADVGLIYTERLNFGDIGTLPPRQSESQTLYEGDLFHPLLETNFITVSSVLIRKDLFEQLGGFDPEPTGCEDWDLWLRFSESCSPPWLAGCVREPLTRYRWRADAMTRRLEIMHRGREIALEKALKTPRALREVSRKQRRRARASIDQISAWVAMESGQNAAAWYYTLQALRKYPTFYLLRQLGKIVWKTCRKNKMP
ncbi:MAG: glycosyltransferase family A protein [Planctomycetia bacterium]|nr:glycosyltransferase family A protein [Planctomycetia bacterium]